MLSTFELHSAAARGYANKCWNINLNIFDVLSCEQCERITTATSLHLNLVTNLHTYTHIYKVLETLKTKNKNKNVSINEIYNIISRTFLGIGEKCFLILALKTKISHHRNCIFSRRFDIFVGSLYSQKTES